MSNQVNNFKDNTTGAGTGINVLANRPVKGAQTDSGVDSTAQSTSGSTTPATINPGQSTTQVGQSQQPQQPNKQAGSGMFTNIKSYVEKNQPAAQKMAGAVSQNVGDQASQIREQTEKKAQIQKDALAANNTALEQEANWANTNIQNVIGGQPQTPPATQNQPEVPQNENQSFTQKDGTVVNVGDTYKAPVLNQYGQITGYEDKVWQGTSSVQKSDENAKAPVVPEFSDEDIARMQALYRGEVQGLTQVGDLNLSQQQARIQALQNMAQGANTEQGRMNLLKNTFGNQGQTQYTRGLSGLDQLIVSGDQAAREQLVSGTQGQVQGLSQDVQGIQQDVNTQRMAQEQALREFGSSIQDQINQGVLGIETGLDTAIANEKAYREGTLGDYQSNLEQMQTTYSSLAQEMNNVLNSGNLTSGVDTSKLNLSPQALEKMGLTQEEINSLSSNIPNTYIRIQKYPGGPGEKVPVPDTEKIGQRKSILEKLSRGLNSLSTFDPFSASMTEQGFNMERLLAGEDLTRSNVATQEQVDRFNMLKKFMGQSDLMDRGSYATADDINSGLANLSNYGIPISQTTGPRTTK
jgi:hypothetical protein